MSLQILFRLSKRKFFSNNKFRLLKTCTKKFKSPPSILHSFIIQKKSISSQEKSIVRKYAPVVYLHPKDMNRPSSIESYLSTVNLIINGDNGTIKNIIEDVDVDTLSNNTNRNNYLQFKNNDLPNSSNEYPTGDIITGNVCKVPCYVNVDNNYTDYYRITYGLFYPFHSFQLYRANITTENNKSIERSFPLSRMGRYEGQWEHISIYINKNTNTMEKIVVSQNNLAECKNIGDDGITYENPEHIKLYSSLNSHSNYYANDTITKLLLYAWEFGKIKLIRTVDVTSLNELVTYNKVNENEYLKWYLQNNLIFVDEDENCQKWLQYKGRYGRIELDNAIIDEPPKSLPIDIQKDIIGLANKILLTPSESYKKFTIGQGDYGPSNTNWWKGKDDQVSGIK